MFLVSHVAGSASPTIARSRVRNIATDVAGNFATHHLVDKAVNFCSENLKPIRVEMKSVRARFRTRRHQRFYKCCEEGLQVLIGQRSERLVANSFLYTIVPVSRV